MPSQKAIKERIDGIKGTQKVTKAMKLIATIKLKQVQDFLNSYKGYQKELLDLLSQILDSLSKNQVRDSLIENIFFKQLDNPKLKEIELLIIFSSDRGLCGSYNLQVFKAIENYFKENSNQETLIITVGKKAQKFACSNDLKRKYPKLKIIKSFSNFSVNPKLSEAKRIFEYLEKFLDTNKITQRENNFRVKTIFSDFQNRLGSEVKIENLNNFEDLERLQKQENQSLIFEPSPSKLLNQSIKKYLVNKIFYSLLSARTSELSYRVNSMTSATENAEKLIKDLTVTYNKARQTSITQEIIEVISGSTT